MKKCLLLLTMILLVGLAGCTPKTELENENNIESKALELNKTTLAELLRKNQIKDFSAEFNEETEKWIINHEYGTYEIANIKLNDSSTSINLDINENEYGDVEVNLILVNEHGEKKVIYNENYVIMSDNFENINLEFTEFKDYIIVCYTDAYAGGEYLNIYDENLDQVISEYVMDGYIVSNDKILFSKYEYFTEDELKMYEIPEPNNIYRQDCEIIEENNELKINKIKDDFLDYSFTEQVP